jgi:nucleotide-binding universal stress UspA family protein
MIGIQSILAATDFSTDARHAAERAAMICATTGISRGVLLHVLESSWLDTVKRFVSLSTEVEQTMEGHASRSLDELGAAIRKGTGFTFEPQVCVGKVLDAILEVSADFDLLALGARGKHPLRDFAIGTTAERLLRQTRTPILVVKRKAAAAYRRVLVAVDFSPHSHTALAYSYAIAPQSEIYLAHVYEVPFQKEMLHAGVAEEIIHECRVKARYQADTEMRRFIEESGADTSHLHRSIEHGSHVPTKLRDKAIAIDADLVIVGKHGKSLAEHLLLGSVTLHLLADCPCDVLVTQ